MCRLECHISHSIKSICFCNSETGSGKTAAFCLPIIQIVHERLRESEVKNSGTSSRNQYPLDIRLSDCDRDALLTIATDGLTCLTAAGKRWAGARATHGVKNGSYYFEVTIRGGPSSICRVGMSSMAGHLELGRDSHGFGYGGTGKKSNNNTFEDYGGVYGDGDTVGCYVDWKARTISFSKNKTFLGVAFQIPESLVGSVLFPAVVLKGAEVTFNFGKNGHDSFKSFIFPSPGSDTTYHPLVMASPSDVVSSSSKEAFERKDRRLPLAVIVEPAKELAEQVGVSDTTQSHIILCYIHDFYLIFRVFFV